MNFNLIDYIESEELSFGAKVGEHITFIGKSNSRIVKNVMFITPNDYLTVNFSKITPKNVEKLRKQISLASFDFLEVNLAETVKDTIAYPLESLALPKSEMIEKIDAIGNRLKLTSSMELNPKFLSLSSKAKLLIASALITNPKILVIDNLLKCLDKNDYELVKDYLNEYKNNKGIVLNFTEEIEETLIGDQIIITDEKRVLISGKTLSVLNEERLLKRLGIGLPFIILLNKYLKDYELINNYILNYDELAGELWK